MTANTVSWTLDVEIDDDSAEVWMPADGFPCFASMAKALAAGQHLVDRHAELIDFRAVETPYPPTHRFDRLTGIVEL